MSLEEHRDARDEREEVVAGQHVARDAQPIDDASAVVVERADRVPVARRRFRRSKPRGLDERGALERAHQLAIRVLARDRREQAREILRRFGAYDLEGRRADGSAPGVPGPAPSKNDYVERPR